tara:strand:+ start:23743 stop:25263 length:1521 start_codon:yes stop_codon:yes gene_type:complete
MATIYSKERGKYGNISGQIIVWPVEIDNNINSTYSKRELPAGYLRCDGTVYNAIDYPQLAAICGTGTGGKFVRRNLAGEPLQSVSDQQFVVPDLGSKYPKPTGSAGGGGVYQNIRVTTVNNVEKSRSGIGIEAEAIAATNGVIDVAYTGNFVVPSVEMPMRGRPVWTAGTAAGKRTEVEAVDQSALHGHMHFHSGTRTRLKARAEVDESSPTTILDPAPIGPVGLANASTIPLHKWIVATSDPTTGNSYPGNAQQPCKAIASNIRQSKAFGGEGKFGYTNFGSTPLAYSNACINGNQSIKDAWNYMCLLPPESYLEANGVSTAGGSPGDSTRAWDNYPITTTPYTVTGDSSSSLTLTVTLRIPTPFGSICIYTTGPDSPVTKDVDMPATYLAGAQGVPIDWKDSSWADSMPLQMNDLYPFAVDDGSPSTTNEFNQTNPLYAGGEDPTEHFHKIDLEKEDHTFQLKTSSTEISADLLETKLNLSTDDARSVDNVSQPFIILEYLIKI